MPTSLALIAALALAVQADSSTEAPRLRAQVSRSVVGKPALAVEPVQKHESLLRELRGGNGRQLPRELQLFIGAAGIFFSFSIFAVLQARWPFARTCSPTVGYCAPTAAAACPPPPPSRPRPRSQEDVYKKAYGGEYFAFTFFALVLERGINALTAFLGNLALGPSGHKIPYKEIFSSGEIGPTSRFPPALETRRLPLQLLTFQLG
jgi:hypothetical protein